jgi:hypothetical protein
MNDAEVAAYQARIRKLRQQRIAARFAEYDPDWLEYLDDKRAREAGTQPLIPEPIRHTPPVSGTHGPSRSRHNPYPSRNGRLLDDPANDWT